MYVGYGGAVLCYVFCFHLLISGTEFILLGTALSCFALSVLIDWLEPEWMNIFLVEDGVKLIGILSWMTYFLVTGYRHILHQRPLQERRADQTAVRPSMIQGGAFAERAVPAEIVP